MLQFSRSALLQQHHIQESMFKKQLRLNEARIPGSQNPICEQNPICAPTMYNHPMTPIFTVSELHEMLNMHLAHLGEITIEGEISELKPSGTQWLYVTLKDDQAVIKLFATQWDIRNWKQLQVGMQVRVAGVVRTYAKYGTLSVTATKIEPAGEGMAKLAFEKLKKLLESEGLFDQSRKRELPTFPQKIGLITAKNSQAYNDFIKVLSHRIGGMEIIFVPVQVQGDSAPDLIAQAISYLNSNHSNLDVIVLCRGGGSQEDLQAFNTETVARAVFSSTTPTIVGVGHEGDVSLADLVADVRASTPSNAAELLVKERESVLQHVHMLRLRSNRAIEGRIQGIKMRAHQAHTTILQAISSSIAHKRLAIQRLYLVQNSLASRLDQYKHNISHLVRLLDSLDPIQLVTKGYSIARTADGTILTSISQVRVGDRITTQLSDGTIGTYIDEVQSQQ